MDFRQGYSQRRLEKHTLKVGLNVDGFVTTLIDIAATRRNENQ